MVPVGVRGLGAVQYRWVRVLLLPGTGLPCNDKPARVSSTSAVVPADEETAANRMTASLYGKIVLAFTLDVRPGRAQQLRSREPVYVAGGFGVEFQSDFFHFDLVKDDFNLKIIKKMFVDFETEKCSIENNR